MTNFFKINKCFLFESNKCILLTSLAPECCFNKSGLLKIHKFRLLNPKNLHRYLNKPSFKSIKAKNFTKQTTLYLLAYK